MADVWSIISANYKAVGGNTNLGSSRYVAVDPKLYQGTWTGTYPDKKTFKLTVAEVDGFRAQVRYQSGNTVQNQQVLIKDQTFRFGNTKFTLQGNGQALIKNVVTDPKTGSTYLDQALAKRI